MPENETRPENTRAADDGPGQFCPVCSTRLQSWRCKLVCPRCGFFISCAEFE